MMIKNSPLDFSTRKNQLTYFYNRYVWDYKQYLILRGFENHVNDRIFIKRAFLDCWVQPGFHCFWKTWNPGIGYFIYKLYLFFGGNTRRNVGTLSAFLINGLIHNLFISLLLFRWDFPLPFTFGLFGCLTILSRYLDVPLKMSRWPKIVHLGFNVGLIILGFDFGFFMNKLLHSLLAK